MTRCTAVPPVSSMLSSHPKFMETPGDSQISRLLSRSKPLGFLLKAQLSKFFDDLPLIGIFPYHALIAEQKITEGKWEYKTSMHKCQFHLNTASLLGYGLDFAILVEEYPYVHICCRDIMSRYCNQS